MKVKTLVALVSSLLVVSFSCAASSAPYAQWVADDATSSQTPSNDGAANPGAMDGGNPTATPSDTGTSPTGADDSSSNSTGTGSDEESQDQATGDSDY